MPQRSNVGKQLGGSSADSLCIMIQSLSCACQKQAGKAVYAQGQRLAGCRNVNAGLALTPKLASDITSALQMLTVECF